MQQDQGLLIGTIIQKDEDGKLFALLEGPFAARFHGKDVKVSHLTKQVNDLFETASNNQVYFTKSAPTNAQHYCLGDYVTVTIT